MPLDLAKILQGGSLRRNAFATRAVGYALAALMGAAALYTRAAPGWQWGLMLVFGAWPLVANQLAKRARDGRLAERRNFLVDAAVIGAMLPLMAFNVFPCAALLIVTMVDKFTVRMRGLLLQALPFYVGGALLSWAIVQPKVQFDTPLLVELASLPFLMLYFLAAALSNWRKRQAVGETYERLERAVQEDGQTGLLTRDSWIGKAASALAFFHSRETPSCIVLIDLDGFRRINQVYGHQVADEYLRAVGDRLRGLARQGTLLGRYGGDQFALLLPAARVVEAEVAARRFHAGIQGLRLEDWPDLSCTCSVGLASTSTAFPGIREWLDATEHALQRAKRAGGDRIDIAA